MKKKDLDYALERFEEEISRLQKVAKYLIDKLGIPESEKKVITDSLHRW